MNDSRGAALVGELINLLPNVRQCMTFFFSIPQERNLEIVPGYQDLVKDINPAAILAEYPDIGPQYI
jgi:hypothetical protein